MNMRTCCLTASRTGRRWSYSVVDKALLHSPCSALVRELSAQAKKYLTVVLVLVQHTTISIYHWAFRSISGSLAKGDTHCGLLHITACQFIDLPSDPIHHHNSSSAHEIELQPLSKPTTLSPPTSPGWPFDIHTHQSPRKDFCPTILQKLELFPNSTQHPHQPPSS